MDQSDDLHARCEALRLRSARLQADAAAIRDTFVRFRRPAARQRASAPATGGAVYDAPLDPHDAAMEALRTIRAIIDAFPLEWQIAIVKALTARTIVMTRERLRPPPPPAITA
jgi:hypothetical protein